MYLVYDILIDNPGYLINHNHDKLFLWHNYVRVVFKNGTVSDIGYYDLEGNVRIKNKNPSFFSTFFGLSDETKYSVANYSDNILLQNINDIDGFMILDKTYKYLTKNTHFKKIIKHNNLFLMLQHFNTSTFKKTGPPQNYLSLQKLKINSINYNSFSLDDTYVFKCDIWAFTDPDSKSIHAIKNKKRIQSIIKTFLHIFPIS
jgi:hypothetical protein